MAIELSEKQIKDGWQIVKFGEIAKNISKRVEPSETNLEVYVGLEHLDPQSLRITRRGVPADVKGQKLRVRPGQIIFGKRRAYQKKVAVADFEGICSAHAMVLEEVVGKIIPGLLPFFMQSDMFMDRAVAISEGSLSPTIKWKTLAIQEFPLPPIERQKEILEVYEKLNSVENISSEAADELHKIKNVLIHKISISDKNISSKLSGLNYEIHKVEDLCKIERGRVISKKYINDNAGDYPVYSSQSIGDGSIGSIDSYDYEGEYLTWTTDGAYAGTIFRRNGKFNCTNVCGLLSAKNTATFSMDFFYYYLSAVAKRHVSYVGNPKLMSNIMAKIPVHLPSLENQERISKALHQIDIELDVVTKRISRIRQLRSGYSYEVFLGGVL